MMAFGAFGQRCMVCQAPKGQGATCFNVVVGCWFVSGAAIAAIASGGVAQHCRPFTTSISNAATPYGHKSKTPHLLHQPMFGRAVRRCGPKNVAIANRKNMSGIIVVVNALGKAAANGCGRKKSVPAPRFAILGILAWGWLCCRRRSRPQKANGAAPAGRGAATMCLGMAMGMGALGTRLL